MKKILVIILSIFITRFLLSQDTNTLKYLPLKVGNIWVYNSVYTYPFSTGSSYNKFKITGVVSINNKTYFQQLLLPFQNPKFLEMFQVPNDLWA